MKKLSKYLLSFILLNLMFYITNETFLLLDVIGFEIASVSLLIMVWFAMKYPERVGLK